MWLNLIVLAQALSAPGATDFGERIVPGSHVRPIAPPPPRPLAKTPLSLGTRSLNEAVALARGMGRITSTLRSPEHNRAVGGVPNSYHLSGRAIDIVRAPGITHQALAASFRHAGFQLVEALDEGDHSHVAFAWGRAQPAGSIDVAALRPHLTQLPAWKWISAPRFRR
ncbi:MULTISPECIES: D-Ala-D-Ala carboxypeptidase family metallohydrolase [Sphingomonas]|uniref:D-Ala-D-Ala carboxypeptidase family metallohydrolase n=1 Tax=Sphingomonas TaxID=13687 RepID=UPI0019634981|nr:MULTISPECIES: D-Ala-D-Ala carboxypeptidase family metallohydrolase [Sphingomonas]